MDKFVIREKEIKNSTGRHKTLHQILLPDFQDHTNHLCINWLQLESHLILAVSIVLHRIEMLMPSKEAHVSKTEAV
jgi:hypothetical protein